MEVIEVRSLCSSVDHRALHVLWQPPQIACPNEQCLELFASRNAHSVSLSKAKEMMKRWERDPNARIVAPFLGDLKVDYSLDEVCGGGPIAAITGKRARGPRNAGSYNRQSTPLFTTGIRDPELALAPPESFCLACVVLSPESRRKLLRAVPAMQADVHAGKGIAIP